MLKDNLHQVQQNIKAACDRAHRNYSDVTLIAVSKTKPVEMLSEIYDEASVSSARIRYRKCVKRWKVNAKDIHMAHDWASSDQQGEVI